MSAASARSLPKFLAATAGTAVGTPPIFATVAGVPGVPKPLTFCEIPETQTLPPTSPAHS